MDLRPPIGAFLDAFGLDAVVTPVGEDPVDTTAIWLPPVTADYPTGNDFRRAEPRRVLALPLDGLPKTPRGAVVTVAEHLGADTSDWKIDEAERVDYDHYRCVVVPA